MRNPGNTDFYDYCIQRPIFNLAERIRTHLPECTETGWQHAINDKLNDTHKALTASFSVQEWLSLESIYFEYEEKGVEVFLDSLALLHNADRNLYQHFRSTVLKANRNWSSLLNPEFNNNIHFLTTLSVGGKALWMQLLTQHTQTSYNFADRLNANVVDFAKQVNAFKAFMAYLFRNNINDFSPSFAVRDAHNMFTSLSRLYRILENSGDKKEQMEYLDGLSLTSVGAVQAGKEEFLVVHKGMELVPTNARLEPTLSYSVSEQSFIQALNSPEVTAKQLRVFLFRHLGKAPHRHFLEIYEQSFNLIDGTEATESEKKLTMTWVVLSSLSPRQLNALPEPEDFTNAIMKSLQLIISKKLASSIIEQHTFSPTLFNISPNLVEFAKFLTIINANNVNEGILYFNRLLVLYGPIVWTRLCQTNAQDLESLKQEFSLLSFEQIEAPQFPESLTSEEIAQLQTLLDYIEPISVAMKQRLLHACETYKQTNATLEDTLIVFNSFLREKRCPAQNVAELLILFAHEPIKLNVLKSFLNKGRFFPNTITQEQLTWGYRAVSLVQNQIGAPRFQLPAIEVVKCLIQETSENKDAVVQFFIETLSNQQLSTQQVMHLLNIVPAKVFCANISYFNDPRYQSLIYIILQQNPQVFNLLYEYSEKPVNGLPRKQHTLLIPVLLLIISTQPYVKNEELTRLFDLLANKSDDDLKKIEKLYQSKVHPPIASLCKALTSNGSLDTLVLHLDCNPYIKTPDKFDESQLLREIAEFSNLSDLDDRLDELGSNTELRIQRLKQIRELNKIGKTIALLPTEEIEKNIQHSTTALNSAFSANEALILLANLREYAYRTTPNNKGEGLFANTTQMLAVLTAIFNANHTSLQLPTGEGKTLAIALFSSFQTLLNQKPQDLVTSNVTLAKRDAEQFANFYAGCGIRTSVIHANSTLPEYITQGPGINITDLGSLALFLGKHNYEGELLSLGNDLILDEGDDALLDKRTQYNHPTSREGNAAGMQSNLTPLYNQLMAWKKSPSFMQGTTRADDVSNAISYIATQGNYSVEELSTKAAQINSWIDAAISADNLREGIDFIILHETRTIEGDERTVRYARIITDGRVDYEAQWGEGVHQLLHARLNLRAKERGEPENFLIDPEQDIVLTYTAKNIIDKYKKNRITSLTATPGSFEERAECIRKYGMDFYYIPPHNPSRRVELPTWFAEDNKAFVSLVEKQILHCQTYQKPIVIICKTPKDVEELHKVLQKRKLGPIQVLTGEDPSGEEKVIALAGTPGMITIATEMVSRGTDIKVSDPKKGLRVLQTFPSKERNDIQIKGRSARAGQEGEYGLLLNLASLEEPLAITGKFIRKNTALLQNLWKKAEKKEEVLRHSAESFGDIKNLLNQMLCRLKSISSPRSDDSVAEATPKRKWNIPESLWINLLNDFDEYCKEVVNLPSLAEQQLALLKWCAEHWFEFCQNIEAADKELENHTSLGLSREELHLHANIYQLYLHEFINTEKTRLGIPADEVESFDTQIDLPWLEGSVDVENGFVLLQEKLTRWGTTINGRIAAESERIMTDIEQQHHSAELSDKAKAMVNECFIRHRYDPNLHGFAKINSNLFNDTIATIRGERPLFANFRAWWDGHGTLFADTKAILCGQKPLFANLRMFFDTWRLNREIKWIEKVSSQVTEEGQVELAQIKRKLGDCRHKFYKPVSVSEMHQLAEDVVERKRL